MDTAATSDHCDVDHATLMTTRLIGDGGWVWAHCPSCGQQVEGKETEGNTRFLGEAQVKGKFTPRQWAAVVRAKASFLGGYFKS